VDECCLVGGEIDGGRCDVCRRTWLTRWRRDHRRLRSSGEIAGFVAHHPRGEGVHPDALRTELGRPGTGECFEGALRCTVDSTCGDSEASDPGAEVDDDASASFDHSGDQGGG